MTSLIIGESISGKHHNQITDEKYKYLKEDLKENYRTFPYT